MKVLLDENLDHALRTYSHMISLGGLMPLALRSLANGYFGTLRDEES